MPRTYVPVRERMPAPDPTDPGDVPAAKGGVVEFVQKLSANGVVPDLTPHQRAFLEMFDGGRPPMRGAELQLAARRAGRRYIKSLIAAHAILTGQDVHFAASTAEEAGRARDDAMTLVEDFCRLTATDVPHVTLTIAPREEEAAA